jgi:hypothetical protein
VDDPLLSCNPLRATRDHGSYACESASCHQMNIWCRPHSGRRGLVAEGAASHGLIIRLIIHTIRRDPSGSVWTDEASNVSRPDPSGADQTDAEHQSTDLAARIRTTRQCVSGEPEARRTLTPSRLCVDLDTIVT